MPIPESLRYKFELAHPPDVISILDSNLEGLNQRQIVMEVVGKIFEGFGFECTTKGRC